MTDEPPPSLAGVLEVDELVAVDELAAVDVLDVLDALVTVDELDAVVPDDPPQLTRHVEPSLPHPLIAAARLAAVSAV
jgi:hypothetical protein